MFSWFNFNPSQDLNNSNSKEAEELVAFIGQYHDIPCAISNKPRENRSRSEPYILPIQYTERLSTPYQRPSIALNSYTRQNAVQNIKGKSIQYKNITDDLKKKHKNCPICSDDFEPNTQIFITPCSHVFCDQCMYKWTHESNKKNCPMCRTNL
jgi:hypothetical protein